MDWNGLVLGLGLVTDFDTKMAGTCAAAAPFLCTSPLHQNQVIGTHNWARTAALPLLLTKAEQDLEFGAKLHQTFSWKF